MVVLTALAFIIFGAFLTLLLHEMSHVLIARIVKYKIESVTLIPRYGEEGTILFGSVKFLKDDKPVTSWMYLIPLIKAFVFFILWFILSKYFHYFIFFAAWELMDGINWLLGFINQTPRTDGCRFRECLRSRDIDIS